MSNILITAAAGLLLVGAAAEQASGAQMWVSSDTLNRRTCPSVECGIVGIYFFREAADVVEKGDGWARVTKYYDASCVGGRSEYVEKGNAACTAANGIVDGHFAEWVSTDFLVSTRPADPAADASGTAALVGQSDDFRKYETAFVASADKLMADGTCTASNFREMGGWIKSMNNKNEPVYFTYCGPGGNQRIYLNAETGRTFR